jgi:hypothetical protein
MGHLKMENKNWVSPRAPKVSPHFSHERRIDALAVLR